ncbi:MAG: FliA/WhiG family RNA polymerase sigma factor [Armatimonadetes bacterium]|nr:FliA/WhiG family RNA polymerase sigma factor [Armatimonadota bacterium]
MAFARAYKPAELSTMSKAEKARREELVRRYAPLVKLVVSRIAGHLPEWVEYDDLLSAGVLGLLKAIDRFDPARGVKFETYATPLIRGEVLETLREKDWVPRGVRRRAREVARAVADLEGQLGRPPTAEEIAERLGVSCEEYETILTDTARACLLSLEEVFAEGEDAPPVNGRQVVNHEAPEADPLASIEREELKRIIAGAVDRLPEREKQVLALYYQEGMTLKEIGAVLGVTESRVCQIHSQAMARVRAAVLREIDL